MKYYGKGKDLISIYLLSYSNWFRLCQSYTEFILTVSESKKSKPISLTIQIVNSLAFLIIGGKFNINNL